MPVALYKLPARHPHPARFPLYFMSIKQLIKRATRDSVFYATLRDIYQYTFNREPLRWRQGMASLLCQFISDRDLIFDVGANIGEYTEVFAKVAGRVVAVEPNPKLIPTLRAIRPHNRITVECTALGSKETTGELFLCQHESLATLSQEWMDIASKSERFSGVQWTEKISVGVSTLDSLIAKYGAPRYIKIDVEGFEREVLEGLSQAPEFVSVEFNSESPETAAACLKMPCFSSLSRFNIVLGLSTDFIFDEWVCREGALEFLRHPEFEGSKTWGDIFICSGRTPPVGRRGTDAARPRSANSQS